MRLHGNTDQSKLELFMFSCKDAEKWDWTQYKPAGIDGSKFYTFLFMAEVRIK